VADSTSKETSGGGEVTDHEYREFRQKQLLREMKICKTYMLKVAAGLWYWYGIKIEDNNYKAVKMEIEADLLAEWIEDVENGK
jgi:hypothetical protein